MKNNKKNDKRLIIKAFGLLTQLGLTMACCVLIGLMAGKFLDGWLGTTPVLIIIFTFIGLAAALKVMYDIVKDWK